MDEVHRTRQGQALKRRGCGLAPSSVGEGGRLLFVGEVCAKGTALVAKAALETRGILGREVERVEVAVEVERPTFFRRRVRDRIENPRNGAEELSSSAKSRVEQSVRVVKTAEAQSAGDGCPARGAVDRRSIAARTLHATGNVEGDQNPTRGGSTHWAGAGRHALGWMSTGRPRDMR